jgi:mutual gliding-motility protein MglA
MAETHADRGEVNARIVYWGIEGGGKSTNLRAIHARLRPDHRGRLEAHPTRLDPTVEYETLPIELGEIAGLRTRIQVIAVPGGAEHAPTRKQLLDRVDGLVFVVDGRRERLDANLAAFDELRGALAAYGRRLEEIPLVVQYNRRDQSDSYTLEELHRKLDLRDVAVFETVASEGTGVLQTLTTISKRVVRALRDGALPARTAAPAQREAPAPRGPAAIAPPPPAEGPTLVVPTPRPSSSGALERAALAPGDDDALERSARRAQGMLDASWPQVSQGLERLQAETDLRSLRIVAAEEAEIAGDHSVVLPLILADPDGKELRFRLTLSLEALEED